MTNAQEKIDRLGAMSAALLLTDSSAKLSDDVVAFTCDADGFRKTVTRAVSAALCMLPYQDMMGITLELQRKSLGSKGFVLPETTVEKESAHF